MCLRAPVVTTDLFTNTQAFRMPGSRTQEGFLLVEAICAIALCALISFLVAHYQATMLIWYHDGSQRLRAITLIQNYCEQYKAQSQAYTTPLIAQEQERDNKFVITQELLPSKQAGFYPVRITIAWPSMQNKQEKIVVYTACVKMGQNSAGKSSES